MILYNEGGIILTAFDFPIGSNIENSILYNIISDNNEGIYLILAQSIKINYNNFIDNKIHANFSSSYFCNWENNYWDDWNLLYPRPIYGDILFFYLTLFFSITMNQDLWISIPWIKFDWEPAIEPYHF